MKRLVLLVAIVAVSCSKSTPAAPTTTTTTAPAVQTLTFSSDTAAPAGQTFSLIDRHEGVAAQIAIGLQANAFDRLPCTMYRATIVYDAAILSVVNYSEGDWMKQGGAIPTFAVTAGGNSAVIRIDRPTSFPGANGSGIAVTLRFKPATPTTRGSSGIQWTDPHCYTPNFTDTLVRAYNGTVTIQ